MCDLFRFVLVRFCFETLARSGDKREGDIFLKYLSYIKTMLKQNPDASKWFLRTFCLKEVTRSARNITIYSLQCRNQLVIDGFCDLVVTVLKFLQQREEKRLDETSQQGFICASSNLMYHSKLMEKILKFRDDCAFSAPEFFKRQVMTM